MNEVGQHFDIQQLVDLVGQQAMNVNAIARTVGTLSKKVDSVEETVNGIKVDIEYMKYREEITYEQQNAINAAVSRTVYGLLGIKNKPSSWTVEERTINAKYGKMFRKRLRIEVSDKGHLAYPYRTTQKGNFANAIKDIEAWTPRNGIAALMKEADDNALARRIAQEQGYR